MQLKGEKLRILVNFESGKFKWSLVKWINIRPSLNKETSPVYTWSLPN